MSVPSVLKTSSWLEKLTPLGSMESKQLSKVNVFSFFFPSALARVVCEGEGMETTLAVPRDNSRWLNGLTRIATWKCFHEIQFFKVPLNCGGDFVMSVRDNMFAMRWNFYAVAFAAVGVVDVQVK